MKDGGGEQRNEGSKLLIGTRRQNTVVGVTFGELTGMGWRGSSSIELESVLAEMVSPYGIYVI